MNTEYTKAEAKKAFPILDDTDFRKMSANADGTFNDFDVRRIALRKSIDKFNEKQKEAKK